MNDRLLEKYAEVAVCSGINIQKGQLLVINASVDDAKFARLCAKAAYKAGAGRVSVNWSDDELSVLNYTYCETERLANIPQWSFDKRKSEQDEGAAYLSIASSAPDVFKDIDPAKMKTVRLASMKKMAPLRSYTMANKGQWCIVGVPSAGWAKKVFPELAEEEAIEALWQAILKAVRISEDNDPVVEWRNHDDKLANYCRILNENNFKTLHFENSLGTDLYVDLVEKHNWAGGSCFTVGGVEFNPNMPTEECFCMPHKDGVNGKVVATKPLSYGGKLLENFWFEFKDGRVENYGSDTELETLTNLLDTDEGSRRLGEVALISYDSPISLMNVLFYETLYDENASCHLALGRAYPENVEGGTEMSEEQLSACGANDSLNHVDFMFGSSDMKVTGIKHDGTEVKVFENGNFVF